MIGSQYSFNERKSETWIENKTVMFGFFLIKMKFNKKH